MLYLLEQQQIHLFGRCALVNPAADLPFVSDIVHSVLSSLEPLVRLPHHVLSRLLPNGSVEADACVFSLDPELLRNTIFEPAASSQIAAPPPPSQQETAFTWTQKAHGVSGLDHGDSPVQTAEQDIVPLLCGAVAR